MRIVNLLVLICFVSLIFLGQTMYSSDVEYNTTRDIYKTTEETFNWSNYSSLVENSLDDKIGDSIKIQEYEINSMRIKGVLIKFIDFVGFSTFEVTKFGIEYGYKHPEQDLGFFLNFLIKVMWIFLIIALVPLVVPVLAIIYLSIKGIVWLIKRIFGVKDE